MKNNEITENTSKVGTAEENLKSPIKELRTKMRLSQSQFAKYFGINVRLIQHWEQQRSKEPSYLAPLLERIVDLENNIEKSKGKV